MQNHTKVYTSFFGIGVPEEMKCEVCGDPATDIHHINARGMGGNPKGDKDEIDNLMALCRTCHDFFGDKKKFKHVLNMVHQVCIDTRNFIVVQQNAARCKYVVPKEIAPDAFDQ